MSDKIKIQKSIIFSGQIASGKTAHVDLVSLVLDQPVVSFSKYLKKVASSKNLPLTRPNLQNLGQIFIEEDPRCFLLKNIEFTYGETPNFLQIALFDGVRHFSIFKIINEISEKVFLIYFDVSPEEREQRYIIRENSSDISLLELEKHRTEIEIEKFKLVADIICTSDKSIKENVDKIVSLIS